MKIGLALSGGGVRGLAHIGVLKAFAEAGISIFHYSGVSAGSLVGTMAAAGCRHQEMLEFWTETKPLSVRNLVFNKPSFFESLNNVEAMRRFVDAERFEDLPFKLTICATAMLKGELHYFDSGPLWPIVIASAAFPIVFAPVEWNDEIYMDGGIINHFPVEPIAESCDFVIGVRLTPHKSISPSELASIRDVMERVMDIGMHHDIHKKDAMCDVLIIPPGIEQYGLFQVSEMLEVFELGYKTALKLMPEIERKIAEREKELESQEV